MFMLRHGESEGHKKGLSHMPADVPLTAQGRKMMRAIAGPVSQLPIQHILTSPDTRCLESAQILAEATSIAWTVIPDLCDVSKGVLTGKILEEIRSNPFLHALHNAREADKWGFHHQTYGMESYEQAFDRCSKFFIAGGTTLHQSLLVMHSGLIRAVFWGGLGRWVDDIPFGQVYRLTCRIDTEITYLDYQEVS